MFWTRQSKVRGFAPVFLPIIELGKPSVGSQNPSTLIVSSVEFCVDTAQDREVN